MTDLGVLGTGTYSEAVAINNSGVIVGSSATVFSQDRHAFKYENGVMTDLGVPDGLVSTYATGISDSGHISGYGYTSAYVTIPLLDTGSGFEDVGYLYTSATGTRMTLLLNDVNSAGDAVGHTLTSDYTQMGVVYLDGVLYDLNDYLPSELAGWRINNCYDISDDGWIAATIVAEGSFEAHAVVLRLVPEPGSLLLLATGMIGLCRRRRA